MAVAFDSPTTRVCSVRLNDVETCLAFRSLEKLGMTQSVTSLSKLARACIALVALQAEKLGVPEPSVMQAREELNLLFGIVGQQRGKQGVVQQVYSEMRQDVRNARGVDSFALSPADDAGQMPASVPTQLWWQRLGCPSEETALRFTSYLRERGITARELSYDAWQEELKRDAEQMQTIAQELLHAQGGSE